MQPVHITAYNSSIVNITDGSGDYGGLRRRSWGRVHMMRSGKRGSEPEYVTEEQDHDMDDTDYMFEPQDQMLYEAGANILQRLAWLDLLTIFFVKKEKRSCHQNTA